MTDQQVVADRNEKIHDPELTAEATRLAHLADMKASRFPYQDGGASTPTDDLLQTTHPDLLDSSVPTEVLATTEALGADGGTHFPENTPDEMDADAAVEDSAEVVDAEAVVEPVEAVIAEDAVEEAKPAAKKNATTKKK